MHQPAATAKSAAIRGKKKGKGKPKGREDQTTRSGAMQYDSIRFDSTIQTERIPRKYPIPRQRQEAKQPLGRILNNFYYFLSSRVKVAWIPRRRNEATSCQLITACHPCLSACQPRNRNNKAAPIRCCSTKRWNRSIQSQTILFILFDKIFFESVGE